MNRTANMIKNRLSLRPPQTESLEILSILADKLEMKKDFDLSAELEKVKALYPTFSDFERTFPSVAFGIATGVGKTRLMGAFLTYLYLEKGIKNFFVMAPNLTIYNKLIEDFSNPSHSKYVFKGIAEFAVKPPRIVTGDNYASQSNLDLYSDVCINVFNISKLNAETRGGKEPRIKRLAEYLGDSYFNYLANLDDLVLLMDESHHYRADRGMAVINDLKPILGLELTATPKVERSGQSIPFKNVVYEYSLARAIQDGFVKQPAVATRKNFDPEQYKNAPEELDKIKLEDGVRIHNDTKIALEIYSRDNKVERVKPFILVVAKDTTHAAQLKELIVSSSFFDGYYADKVMEIHSNQRGEEKEENIEQLLTLESPENKIEIVIHVNMLKEGWDINNLYTIIPLRASASETLTEQTIGRGLRLPYGAITGDSKVDKLTIVSHDKFQAIIDKANEPGSIIKQENIIVIEDNGDFANPKEIVSSPSVIEERLQEEESAIEQIQDHAEKQKAKTVAQVRRDLQNILHSMSKQVQSAENLADPETKEIAIEKLKNQYKNDGFFTDSLQEEAKANYDTVAKAFIEGIIEIPRMIIQPTEGVQSGFKDFNLNTDSLNPQPVSAEIIRRELGNNSVDSIKSDGQISTQSLESLIVDELTHYPEVDYDEQSGLLFKLAAQVVDKLELNLDEDDVQNVVQYQRRAIAKLVYDQMMENRYYKEPECQKREVEPFTKIEVHNYSKYSGDSIYDFKETITPTNSIPSKVFSGFKKSCHRLYKFDSKTEKDFAMILEGDVAVLKWLRPAKKQFEIYWHHKSKQYEPDFVAETTDAIYLVETKKKGDIDSADVHEKAKAASTYCKYATEFTTANGGKPWKYVLIPHDAVLFNTDFESLATEHEYKQNP